MSFSFPSNPTTGQQYAVSGGPTYTWNGTAWVVLTPGQQFARQSYTATASQSSFTVTSGYLVGGVDVYRNGVKLITGTDYVANNGTSIVLTLPANSGDSVEVISYPQIVYSNALKITGDTMTGNLTVPNITSNAAVTAVTGTYSGTVTANNVVASNNVTYSGTLTGGTGIVNIGSGQIYKDASGNLGLGVTPSAWSIDRKPLQFGNGGNVSGSLSLPTFVEIGSNFYVNSSNVDVYLTTGTAAKYRQVGNIHSWHIASSNTAGNLINFTQAMTLDASGSLGVGETSPSTYGRLAVTNNSGGIPVFNVRQQATSLSNGVYTFNVDSSSHISNMSTAGAFNVSVNGGNALTINGLGNVGIGTTSPSSKLHVSGDVLATSYNGGQLAGMRNRIINGAMMIDQRNAGTSVTNIASGGFTYTIDRWAYIASQASKFNVQQNAGSVTPPAGFSNYVGITSSSAYSVGSTEFFSFGQVIEGLNAADFQWGTANAASVAVSFWVRSSLTGTFGAYLKGWATAAVYPFTYTISSANTWTYVTVSVPAPTSGSFPAVSNAAYFFLAFDLGSGSSNKATPNGAWQAVTTTGVTGATNIVGTNGATFYITGVQLEKGTVSTPFENRLYGAELALCQRYFQRNLGGGSNEGLPVQLVGGYTFAQNWYKWVTYPLPVQMRASPTVTWYPNTNSTSESGKARYYTGAAGGAGNNLVPYGFDTTPNYLLLKVYNEHNSFTCYGVGAAYDVTAEL